MLVGGLLGLWLPCLLVALSYRSLAYALTCSVVTMPCRACCVPYCAVQ